MNAYDLHNNHYDCETLKDIIYVVSLVDILTTQKLSAEFCVNYILNKSFQFTSEEEAITLDMVTKYQPHISYMDLAKTIVMRDTNANAKTNFEDYMNAHL